MKPCQWGKLLSVFCGTKRITNMLSWFSVGANLNNLNQEQTIRFYLLSVPFTVTVRSAPRAQKYSLSYTLGLEFYILRIFCKINIEQHLRWFCKYKCVWQLLCHSQHECHRPFQFCYYDILILKRYSSEDSSITCNWMGCLTIAR